jgi:tetratricopeptide (TPR) repeat protein
MRRAIPAALLSAALAFGAAPSLAAEGSSFSHLPHGEFAGVEKKKRKPPAVHEAVRAEPAAEQPAAPAAAGYAVLLFWLTVVVALLIFISSVDDALVDACYWLGGARRRKTIVRLEDKPESAFAIMVPAWKEHDVIAAMVENTVTTLDYRTFRIFCGVYRNDPATASEVDRMAARYPGIVTKVVVPHDGPTCKGDCLNHIVRRVLSEEHETGERFAGIVLHDSEDVIHPLELRLFNTLVPGTDLVQLPVLSLDRKWCDLTAGTYMDDFAEAHGKDMAVREKLVGIVPGAGVATCYSSRGLAALWKASGGEPFNTASLTEDYDLSFRLKQLGLSQRFAHVAVDCPGIRTVRVGHRKGSLVATHEYFPDRFKAAYRQRARWVLGIAFQGWRQMGWRGSALERYFLFRDRKALVMAPAGALAYLLLANFVLAATFGSEELRNSLHAMLSIPLLFWILIANLAFMCNRALQRIYFVGRYYGPLHGALSVLRMPVNNFINFFAVLRAWRQFMGHLVTGKKLAWDKTAHVYPQDLTPQLKAVLVLAACCALALGGPGVATAQAPELTGRTYELADQAYKAIERGQLEQALRLVGEALKRTPGHPRLLLLEADILGRQGKHAEALERIRGLPASDLGGFGLAQRGYIWLQADNAAAAEADFVAALEKGDLDAQARANVASELAYLALKRKDDAAALKWFQMALEHPATAPRPGLYADAGYAATRLGRDREAIALLSNSVDDWHATPQDKRPFGEGDLFGMRRSIDTLSRPFGGTVSIGHSSTQAAIGTGLAAAGSDLRVLQAGAEVFYRPQSLGYRDGRVFQLYANMFQALSANDVDYATGSDSRVAGLGARYKPLRDYNVVFAVERRLALGERAGDDDWVVRAGFSAGRETDWNATRRTWTTWQVYTESVYFIEAERLIVPFEARLGRSWKVPQWHGAVATAFLGVAGEYDEAQQPKSAAGIGPGIALRYWFGETKHRAFPQYLDFAIQYRFRLTDARRGGGFFGQLVFSF